MSPLSPLYSSFFPELFGVSLGFFLLVGLTVVVNFVDFVGDVCVGLLTGRELVGLEVNLPPCKDGVEGMPVTPSPFMCIISFI